MTCGLAGAPSSAEDTRGLAADGVLPIYAHGSFRSQFGEGGVMESVADFVFGPLPTIEEGPAAPAAAGEPAPAAAAAADPLGALAGLAGNWASRGFNVIWRPTRSIRAGRTVSWNST